LSVNNFIFFIEKGSCDVTVKDKHKLRNQDKYVRSLKTGDCFGEIAMIYKERRSSSVSSTNFTTLG
jgi:CRP-like cAMP-binding protein